jgi:hypothetical protein
MQLKNIFTKINIVKLAAALTFSVCDVFLFFIILNARSTAELILNIASFALAIVLSAIFVRSLYSYTKNHEAFWQLVDGLTQTNERIEKLESEKSAFYAIFSEKLRTPLQVVHGYSSMLLEGTLGKTEGQVRELVEKIFHSSDAMSALAEEMISASQIKNTEAPVIVPANQNSLQVGTWKKRVVMIRIFCVLSLALLLLQIILATSTSGLIVRIGITVFVIIISFFITHELALEPESKKTTNNLVGDYTSAQNKLKTLQNESSALFSRVSMDFRTSLANIAENTHKLLDGTLGDIPEAMNDAVNKISQSTEQLTHGVFELTAILSAQK